MKKRWPSLNATGRCYWWSLTTGAQYLLEEESNGWRHRRARDVRIDLASNGWIIACDSASHTGFWRTVLVGTVLGTLGLAVKRPDGLGWFRQAPQWREESAERSL